MPCRPGDTLKAVCGLIVLMAAGGGLAHAAPPRSPTPAHASVAPRVAATAPIQPASVPPAPLPIGADAPAFVPDDPPRPAPGELLVRYRPGLPPGERDRVARAFGVRPLAHYTLIDLDRVQVSEPLDSAIARLRADPRVLYAEPNYIVHAYRTPDDPRFVEQYALHNTGQTGGITGADISALRAWDVFTGDSTLKIGMIDSGIDYTHPDLAPNVWTNPGEIPGNGIDDDGDGYVDDVHGYDFANNDGDPMDDNGHGTHTAGIVAAVGNNGVGVCGVAWRAQLVAIKFLDASGSGTIADAISGLQYAVTVGCRLTSNSWGGGGPSQALLDAINAAGEAGLLFVAAAGNSHVNMDQVPNYPASYNSPYIISVAATNSRDSLAAFSNYGANSVDLAAPGVNILSTIPGERYALLSGTSMACPMVTGVLALALGENPGLGPLAAKAMLLAGVDHPTSLTGLVRTGRLNAFGVIATPDSIPPGQVTDLATGEVGSNTVALTWTATGDDSTSGRASRYDVRWSLAPLTPDNFSAATPVASPPDPSPAGTREAFTATGLPFSSTVYLALRALDEFDNAGPVSNVVSVTTLGIPKLAWAPASVAGTLHVGGVDSSVVTISNQGAGTLDFTIPQPLVAYAQAPPNPPIQYPKGQGGPAGLAVTGHAGGPDAFGYRWIDSDTTAGPKFDWIDVTAIGTQIALNGDDNLSDLVPIGFTFPFYGVNFDSVKVCTNGYLTFTDTDALYSNQPLPSPAAPFNGIMPLWDDLIFQAERRAWMWSDGHRFVVEFVGPLHYNIGGPYTFEVILEPTGEIRYQYLDLHDPLDSSTIGVQDATGKRGLQVVFNAAYVHDSLAVKLVPLGQWTTATPAAGRVPAGESRPVTVHFGAAGLAGGDYGADLRIDTNDPATPSAHVPVSLHVIGAPDLQVTPAALDFGNVYVGARPVRPLQIANPGTDALVVGPIAVSDTTLHPDLTPFTLARFDRHLLPVLWAPQQPGPLAATLTIDSNDPDSPHTVIPITGNALPAPSISASPESLAAELPTGSSAQRTLHLVNSGAGPYVFRAASLLANGTAPLVDTEAPPAGKNAPDTRHGPTAMNAGGPDGFGYTYRDSHEPGGPAFQWEDVRARGVPVALSGDDALSDSLVLAFDFPFYGESFRSLRVCTNGFVTLTGTTTGFANTPLPSQAPGTPENLLAVMWDDLVVPAGTVWFWSDASHAVIQFDGVTRFGETGRPNSFEVVVQSTGDIEYRYLALGARVLNSATVGIQNATRDDGLEVAFNAPYLTDSLALHFARPPRWLTVTPDTGTVAPGSAADLAVTFHAAGLPGGRYAGRIQLDGNDPLAARVEVPARLEVDGVPLLSLDSGGIDFGRVSIGAPRTVVLAVVNAGSDTLRVSKLASSDPRFTPAWNRLTVAPFDRRDVEVTFAPDVTGPVQASLSLQCNDPAQPQRVIALSASGAEPPVATLSAGRFDVALAHGAGPRALSATRLIALGNTGGNDLRYRARAHPGPGAAALSVPLDREGPKGAPPAAATATEAASSSGGPDAFGYRWFDSDDPLGPAFEWIDARASGGHEVALDGDDQTSAPIALPFHFPFYGTGFDSVRVCTNGFASFTSSLTTFTNAPLPNAGAIVPENLLAVFWDDQDFRPTSGAAQVWTLADTSRFVIAFYDVPHLTVGGPYTYEIVLSRDGTIEYRYLQMGTRLTEATIGIQNGDRTIGLQAAYNAAFVHDRLRVRFTLAPPWLVVSPDSGAVAPGGTDTLTVRFSAAGFPDGDYSGALSLDDNELGGGVRELPARLHVGLAPAHARLTSPALAVTASQRTTTLALSIPGEDARGIDAASVRVNDTLAVAAHPAGTSAGAAEVAVDVLGLLRPLGGADRAPVAVTGELPGVTWFAALDTLTISRPLLAGPAGLHALGSGLPPDTLLSTGPIPLIWTAPPGTPVAMWDVWFSPDGGARWIVLAMGLRETVLPWFPPPLLEAAMLEFVGRSGGAPVTALITDPFRLVPADSVSGGRPVTFGLRFTGPNPAITSATFDLALPGGGPAEVTVFDVAGSRVRTLVSGSTPLEHLPVVWDLRDDHGRGVRSGIFFVRATSLGRVSTLRVAVLL